jgi:drug/metabolite transporter (DMT)-like permease
MFKLDFAHKPTQWLILCLLALTWGSSFILMKKALVFFTPDTVATYRIALASLVLFPNAIRNLDKVKGHVWPLLAVGLFGNGLPALLFAVAQTQIPSSLSGILNSLTSLFTLLIGVVLFRLKTTVYQVIGVFVALIGAAGLIGFNSLAAFSENSQYALLAVIAASMYGLAVNTIKSKLPEMRPTHITALSFLMTGPWCLLYLLIGTDFISIITEDSKSWSAVGYLTILAVIGTAAAVVLFNRLIKETTAVFASSVTYLIPVVAVGWGILDGESVTLMDGGFMLFILTGIFLINSSHPKAFLNRLFR